MDPNISIIKQSNPQLNREFYLIAKKGVKLVVSPSKIALYYRRLCLCTSFHILKQSNLWLTTLKHIISMPMENENAHFMTLF